MGNMVDTHQARLNSVVSCRCGVVSREDVDRAEDRPGSPSSYVEPVMAGASPATVPTSAPLEGASEDQEEGMEVSDEPEVHLFPLSSVVKRLERTIRRLPQDHTTIQRGL